MPNYILPFDSPNYYTVFNMYEFQQLMYRPLYLAGVNGNPSVDPSMSLADAPSFSDHNRKVTITLKNYTWSDGTSVTAKDVAFFHNMALAEKDNWGPYSAGNYPDNVSSIHIDSPHQITFHLTQSYSPQWFEDNELTLITPMPPAWDKTSDSAAAGSGGCATSVSKCKAVYNYLSGKAKKLSDYASDPLWQVVDGPWKLSQFNADGHITMVQNTKYSGPDKPHLDKVEFLPFTSDTAEYNALQSGSGIDVGYISAAVAQPKDSPNPIGPLAQNYTLDPWYWWGIDFMWPNYNNPTNGPIFKQLYIRQALEHLVDQQAVIKGAFKGYGYRTNGPVPIQPKNDFSSTFESKAPYPFSIETAKQLLTSHGWNVQPGGTTVCEHPGTTTDECGAGIPGGAKLSFKLEYADYGSAYDQSMNLFRSNAAKAGVQITLKKAPFNTVLADAPNCKPSASTCDWDLVEYGGYSWRPYPTGENMFSSTGGSNRGGYQDSRANSLIEATIHSGSRTAMTQYENYLAKQVPVIWQPMPTEQLTVVNKGLHGVTPQNPLLGIAPENWYFTK